MEVRKFSFLTNDFKTICEIQESATGLQKNEEGEIIEEDLMCRDLERNDSENEDYELEGNEDSIDVSGEDFAELIKLENEIQRQVYSRYSYNQLVTEFNELENEIYEKRQEANKKESALRILEKLILKRGEKIERGEINE